LQSGSAHLEDLQLDVVVGVCLLALALLEAGVDHEQHPVDELLVRLLDVHRSAVDVSVQQQFLSSTPPSAHGAG
jgi:hypothetical protein